MGGRERRGKRIVENVAGLQAGERNGQDEPMESSGVTLFEIGRIALVAGRLGRFSNGRIEK